MATNFYHLHCMALRMTFVVVYTLQEKKDTPMERVPSTKALKPDGKATPRYWLKK